VSPAWIRAHPARVLAFVVGVGVVAAAAWRVVRGRTVEAYVAVRGDLAQSVVATGQVVTPQRASIGSETTARVTRVLVVKNRSPAN